MSSGFTLTDLETLREKREGGASEYGYLASPFGRIIECWLKYAGYSSYGSNIVQMIVDTRSSAILGDGLNLSTSGEIEQRNLDTVLTQTRFLDRLAGWVALSEVEGVILMRVKEENGEVKVRPYTHSTDYVYYSLDPYGELKGVNINSSSVLSVVNDYGSSGRLDKYKQAGFFQVEDEDRDRKVPIDDLVFSGFQSGEWGYAIHTPAVTNILPECEAVTRALDDMRIANHVSGAQTLVLEAHESGQVKKDEEALTKRISGVGQAICTSSKVYYVSPKAEAMGALSEELTTNIELISGITGVPVTRLGFVKLFGTKAGAEEVGSSLYSSTAHQRERWEKFIPRLLKKCGETVGLSVGDVQAKFSIRNENRLDKKLRLYLDLNLSGILSKKTIRELVPDVDLELEEQRLREEEAQSIGMGGEPFSGGFKEEQEPEEPKQEPLERK